jgi:hypothetical protein
MALIRVIEAGKVEAAPELREKLRAQRLHLARQAAPLAERKQRIDDELRTLRESARDGVVSVQYAKDL